MITPRKAFSLVELLVTFALLAVVVTLVVPRYLGLQRGTNLQVAQQQVDSVRKAVATWAANQSSLSALSNLYGSSNTNIDLDAFRQFVVAQYLDPSFAARINVVAGSNSTLAYFTTAEMTNVTGTAAATDQPYGNTGIQVTAASSPPKDANGRFTAYGVVYWPTDVANRRTYQPAVVLFIPQ